MTMNTMGSGKDRSNVTSMFIEQQSPGLPFDTKMDETEEPLVLPQKFLED